MKVSELIKKLQKRNPEEKVYTKSSTTHGSSYHEIYNIEECQLRDYDGWLEPVGTILL